MGQTALTWLGAAHAPSHSFIIGWEPPVPALLWGSVSFKGTWKRKALSLCQWTPPVPTVFSASSLYSPGRTSDSHFLNKDILLHPHPPALLGFFHLEHSSQDLLNTDVTSTINICDKPPTRNWSVWSQYAVSANLYFNPFSVLWDHTSCLMLQNQTPLTAWVVVDPPDGAFTRCPGLFRSPCADGLHPDWQDATFAGRICKPPQASQSTGFMTEFPGPAPGMDHIKGYLSLPQPYFP
jgi:hypothetical protein